MNKFELAYWAFKGYTIIRVDSFDEAIKIFTESDNIKKLYHLMLRENCVVYKNKSQE